MTEDKFRQAEALQDEISRLLVTMELVERAAPTDDCVSGPQQCAWLLHGASPATIATVRRLVMEDLQVALDEKRRQFEAL